MRKYPSNFVCKQCGKPVPRLGRFCRKCWRDPVRRFWTYVKKTPNCWIWIGANRSGYGRLRVNGKKITVTHLSYELHKGKIPNGKFICHSCDNPSCVNPEHLWIGNHLDNARDMRFKGRHRFSHIRVNRCQALPGTKCLHPH